MRRVISYALLSLVPLTGYAEEETPALTAPHRVASQVADGRQVIGGRPPVEVQLTANGYSWARLVLGTASTTPDFTLLVTDRAGIVILMLTRDQFESSADGTLTHVTDILRADAARLRVTPGAVIEIIEIVRGTVTVSVETTVQGLNLSSIDGENPALISASQAVLLLEFSSGDIRRCNAFLVAAEIVITNRHCVDRKAIIDAPYYPRVYAGFASQSRPGPATRVTELLATNPQLDASLLRLKTPLTSIVPISISATDAKKATPLRVIQHYEPRGWQKVVSADEHCAIRETPAVGNDGFSRTDFFHGCDTERGTSGTAVFDTDARLVGLHRIGRKPGFWPDNKAVLTSNIAGWIRDLQNEKNDKHEIFRTIVIAP